MREIETRGSGTPDIELAPAKVNLYLHIVGRRADGYHQLDSLVVFADAADRLSYVASDRLTLALTGPFAAALSAEASAGAPAAVGSGNLVLRAARALAEAAGIQPHGALTLEKNLPVASGIGGGSADAAAALRLLCRAWRIDPGEAALDRIASGLGADVPVCLRGLPRRMGGIGERLTSAPLLPEAGLILVNPGVPVATQAVFRARTGAFSAAAELPPAWPGAAAMAADLARLGNDLEAPAIGLAPAIAAVRRAIAGSPGCLLTRMSGSGATCFGLFETAELAQSAGAGLRRPGWWVWAGGLSR